MDYLPGPAIPIRNTRTAGGNAAFHNFHNDFSHISDPNLRRRLVLRECDNIPFGWYHVRAVIVAGIGFFTDSYDIFAVNLITTILGMVFWQGPPISGSTMGGNYGVLPTSVNTAIKAATSGGAVLGMLGFGWLADRIGRRKMYGVELAVIVFSTLAQSLAAPSKAVTISGLLIFWRVVMGVGIGGDYPLSAVITSEFAPTRWRGAMMAAVFSMQGAGQFTAAVVALITTVAFQESFLDTTNDFSSCNEACQVAGDRAWRIIVGFGAVPAVFALYYRITIPETPRYTFDIARDIEKADADVKAYRNNEKIGVVDPISQQKTKHRMGTRLSAPPASWHDALSYFSQWKNFKIIFATTSSWFFLDLAFYGLTLNNSTVLSAIGYSSGATIYNTLLDNAIGNLVLICAGAIPGYWLSVATIDTFGRKPIQIMGFFFLTIVFSIIGFAYHSLPKGGLLALYIVAQLFFNFGPNCTTFIIPGECFPTRYRSTGHGLSAAWGKIGAIISQVIAQPLLAKGASSHCSSSGDGDGCSPWLNHLMQIFALFMLCGTLVSFLVPETKGRTLEELAGEGATQLDHHRGGGGGSRGTLEGVSASWVRRNNPFHGGRPAGFSWDRSPNLLPRSPGIWGKRERVGIMTSPELLPKHAYGEKKPAVKQHGRAASSGDIGGGAMYSVSVSSNGKTMMGEVPDDDLYIQGSTAGILPGWEAGWGVQRHPRPGETLRPRVESIGKLLK